MMDSTSVKVASLGGSKVWHLMVDDATGYAWTQLVKTNNKIPRKAINLIRDLKVRLEITVKYVRCNNAGKYCSLKKMCEDKGLEITFEFMAPNSPQYNGKVERKLAMLYARTQANLNGAKLSGWLRNYL